VMEQEDVPFFSWVIAARQVAGRASSSKELLGITMRSGSSMILS